jgi:acetylornithine deacetylase/succinyl-diaminopimelate desuccinylase-like protein
MTLSKEVDECLGRVSRKRLLRVATSLIDQPSPTGQAGAAADCLARLIGEAGLNAERLDAGHPHAPAVCVRLQTARPGPTLQFNGHLDVVPLPFVPSRVEGNRLRGSGSADMKGGLATAVEAMFALHDAGWPRRGSLLLTAHDLHEAPWGDGSQLERLIEAGGVGDAILIPEPLCHNLPVRGRGQACWLIRIRRPGPPTHEVMHPEAEPHVQIAAADLVLQLDQLNQQIAEQTDLLAGRSSVFVGQIHCGEMYNQSPQYAILEGTRRWIPGQNSAEAELGLRSIAKSVAARYHVAVDCEFRVVRDAFFLDENSSIVTAFQQAIHHQTGQNLPIGSKPFVDDGNTFWARTQRPAITHGPLAGGQHTTDEWADIDDMLRVARVYAETAIRFWESTANA